jgi:shikimate kinase
MSTQFDHIALLGLMGVGKTTIGRALSARLGWPMSDSDQEIMERCGATVRQLSQRLGVEQMHRLESEHLLEALAAPGPLIVGAAASVVEDERCREALESPAVFCVWLRGSARILVERFAAGPHRPVFDADTEAVFRRQIAERSRRFEAVAELVVDVEGQPADRIAADIATRARAAAR